MHATAEVQMIPIGVGVSLSRYIAACHRVLEEAGLEVELHAYGTNLEGDWETIMQAVRRCHETVHAMGAPRIATTIKIGTRTDRPPSLREKVKSVAGKREGSSS